MPADDGASSEPRRVGIIGASLGGAMAALHLARRGFAVTVYERRGDSRRESVAQASMNLGLSRRGLEALARVGLEERALELAIPMTGRVIHLVDGRQRFSPYGKDREQVIHAVRREDLNALLLDALAHFPRAQVVFHTRCRCLDKESGRVRLVDERDGRESEASFDLIVGADGVFSTVRRWLLRGERVDFSQEFLDWGWKELAIPPEPAGARRLRANAFHLWPRGDALLFAHPNRDRSFTCSLVLPFEGPGGFAELRDSERVRRFFAATFPDLLPLAPDLVEQFLAGPIVNLVTVRISRWYYRGQVVLLGDAAHAVVPFYAQGMNAAFEDCGALGDCLDRHGGDLERAFAAYQLARKPNTDALAEMSKRNFLELRDRVRSPWLRARNRLDLALHRLLARRWMPLHARVTHTTTPYARALALARRQDHILAGIGAAALLSLVLLAVGLL